jgi:hypothetical protein
MAGASGTITNDEGEAMAFHNLVRPIAAGISLLLAVAASADEKANPSSLTPAEITGGWVQLFDGESTFGWKIEGEAKVEDRAFVVGGSKPATVTSTAVFAAPEVSFDIVTADGKPAAGGAIYLPQFRGADTELQGLSSVRGTSKGTGDGMFRPGPVRIEAPAGTVLRVRKFAVRVTQVKPLFNGKDLTGWKQYRGDPKREQSQFTVTPGGELAVRNGPGDLQTEKEFGDFVLQLECKTNGKALNSGVFFRCLPGQYQQGYEAQIQNAYKDGDRTRPADFGTGAIYRRIAARKVVSNDNEWFTITVLARGPHLATWVNGYPVVSWTDDRKPADNARQGLYTKKGPISIQGHDPTTDLLFRNIRIAELK